MHSVNTYRDLMRVENPERYAELEAEANKHADGSPHHPCTAEPDKEPNGHVEVDISPEQEAEFRRMAGMGGPDAR